MMARGMLAGLAAVLVVGVAAAALFVENQSAGRRAREAAAVAPASSPLVALVDGEAVTRADVLEQQALMASLEGGEPPSRAAAFQALVRDLLLAREARRRGLGMDAATAAALAASHRHLYEQKRLPDQKEIEELIASLRIPADVFWSSVVPRLYERSYSVANLRREEGERTETLYRQLRNRALIDVVDPAFLQGR